MSSLSFSWILVSAVSRAEKQSLLDIRKSNPGCFTDAYKHMNVNDNDQVKFLTDCVINVFNNFVPQ